MAKRSIVVAGPKLQQKLHELAHTAPQTDLTASRNVNTPQSIITRKGEGGKKQYEYNGYFTIIDVSTYNEDGTVKEFRVAVCDGETWDSETETSSDSYMTAYTSDKAFSYRIAVKAQVVAVNESSTIAIRYCHGTRSAEIVAYAKPPLQHTGYFYYTIGDVTIKNNVMKIIQRHGLTVDEKKYTNGTAYIDVGYVKDFCVYYIQPEVNDDGTTPIPTEIVVCNGNSWDPVKKTSEDSRVTVNSRYEWNMPPKIIKIEHNKHIYVKVWYDIDKHLKQLNGETEDSESDNAKNQVISIITESAPTGNFEQIATVYAGERDKVVYIDQYHTQGLLRLWGVYYGCK